MLKLVTKDVFNLRTLSSDVPNELVNIVFVMEKLKSQVYEIKVSNIISIQTMVVDLQTSRGLSEVGHIARELIVAASMSTL